VFVQPAVADGVTYFGSCAGVYYAIDVRSGAIVWRHDLRPEVGQVSFHGNALVTDGLVITPAEVVPAHVRAFDRHTGRTVWQRSGEWALTRTDVVGSGRLVVGRNEDGELIALTADSGTPVWRAPHLARRFGVESAESPVAVGSDVIFSGPDAAVYRVDGMTGQPRWRTEIACDVTTAVSVGEGEIYVGCSDSTLFRVRAADGAELGRMALGHLPEGRLLVLADRVVVPGGRGWIGAVTRNLDRLIWERHDLAPLSVVQPMRWGQCVLTGARGQLIALGVADGRTCWTTSLEGYVRGLGAAGDIVLVGTIEGTLYALRGLPEAPL
jgi:outer membrane protein assembly factor BamB